LILGVMIPVVKVDRYCSANLAAIVREADQSITGAGFSASKKEMAPALRRRLA